MSVKVTPPLSSPTSFFSGNLFACFQAIMSALASTDSAGKTYELGGPEIFHYEDLAKMVCDEIYQVNFFLIFFCLVKFCNTQFFLFSTPTYWTFLSLWPE